MGEFVVDDEVWSYRLSNDEYNQLVDLLALITNPVEGYVKNKEVSWALKQAVRQAKDLCEAADSIAQVLPGLETINNGNFTAAHIRKIPFVQQLVKARDGMNYWPKDEEQKG